MINQYLAASLELSETRNLDALHAHFLAILPRIETHAKVHFRYLRCPGKKDDAVQETIAIAWKSFVRANEQGKDVDEFVMMLADFAVRHVRAGRRICGQLNAKDVFSPLAQKRGGFMVEEAPCSTMQSHDAVYSNPHGQKQIDVWEERLRDNTRSPVDEQAAFRIDYPIWLSQLGGRNKKIAEDMTLDLGTFELADMHKISAARISQLRREFQLDWLRFHGEGDDTVNS